MRAILMGLAVGGLAMSGCRHHVHHVKADYHEHRAERAREHGHPVKAAKEKVKEHREEAKARHHHHF